MLRSDASPGNAVLPGGLPGAGWTPTVVQVTRRGGGHAVRARIARAGATRTGPARARAALATPETPGQRRSGADGGAGGRAGQGLPRADPLRGGPRQGREPDLLGNERGSVPRRGSLLLQVRRDRAPRPLPYSRRAAGDHAGPRVRRLADAPGGQADLRPAGGW